MDTRDGPPDDAYRRVTDPERYRRLQVVGRALLDDLECGRSLRVTNCVGRHGHSAPTVTNRCPLRRGVLMGCFGKPCEELCDIFEQVGFAVAQHAGECLFMCVEHASYSCECVGVGGDDDFASVSAAAFPPDGSAVPIPV